MDEPLHLLLIDDDEDEYFLLEEMISHAPFVWVSKELVLHWISSYEQALTVLPDCPYDLILVDYRLGPGNGLDFLREAQSIGCRVPIILLTGQGDYQIDLAAMQLGASDYLVKGELTTTLLERSIRYSLERKQNEDKLRRSELALSKAQRHAKMGSWTWYVKTNMVELSEELRELYRISGDEYVDSLISMSELMERFVYPDDRKKVFQNFMNFKTAGVLSDIEFRLAEPDGNVREVRSEVAETLYDNSGKPVQIWGIAQDITDQRKMEKALIQSEKMAGIGTLAAGMAHEINTPLQVITGASEGLQNRLKIGAEINKSDLERQISHINVNAWRIATIVRSLLDYARSSADEGAVCSLNEIIHSTLPLTARQYLAYSNIDIETRLYPDLPLVRCDPGRMIQVLVNLLNNARDAMPEGGIIIMETGLEPEKGMATLRVIDAGTGIPEAIQHRIFDPFFTSKPTGKGVGLGLAISVGIIKSSGGLLEVERTSKAGTVFKISLPIAHAPNVPQ